MKRKRDIDEREEPINKLKRKRSEEEGDEDINPALKKGRSEKYDFDFDESYWMGFAQNPESYPQFDLEELFNVQSKSLDSNGIWDPSIIIDGTRRTGKSVLAKHICIEAQRRGLIGRISIITGTRQNTFWDDLSPLATIYEVKNGREVMAAITKFQDGLVGAFKDDEEIEMGILQHTVILDDFIGNKTFSRYSDELATAFVNFRHYATAVIALTQYPTGVPPMIRTNTDFAFIFMPQSYQQKDLLWKNYTSFITDRRLAFYLFDSVLRDFRCLSVHKTDAYLENKEKVKWFRAVDWDGENNGHSTIQVGHPGWRDKMNKKDEEIKKKRKKERKMGGTSGSELWNVEEMTNPLQEVQMMRSVLQQKYNMFI